MRVELLSLHQQIAEALEVLLSVLSELWHFGDSLAAVDLASAG